MSKKRLNLHEQGYKAGDPMWVSWDKRWDGPLRRELMWEGVYQEERLVTTIGFFRYDDREFLALDRTKRPNGCEDIIYIPTPLVKEYGKFHAEQYSTFIRYIFVYNTLVSERLNVRIRRYAEATNYAKVLTGVYNGIPKGENGMIVKYQEPAHGVARRDAIKDYRPEIPLSPIKQPVKPYMPTQQPILSPDNRTGWEKEVSRQIKADRAKNDNLYGNQHTWNWSAPFTNARITKDNASAMFDFDKSAAMSTFAIGQGIASPVTTATSIATSLVGAGIGNKVAGEKGALVGGFVGGMVNPKIRFGKSSSTNQIRKDLIYGSKINGKMARLSQAEAEKANQEGYHNALSVIANPVVVATAKRNAEVAKRIGFKPLVYGINGKPVEFDNSSALHFYIMADEYPTSKIVRTDLGGMATGRWVRDPKTKQDRIELDNSVGDYKTAEEIFTHENLHKGRYGETRMQMLRVNKLIDEARAAEALPQMPEYLLGAGEAAVNTNDVRRALGLEFGQKYPGWKITKEIVDMFSRSKHPKAFVMKSFKQDTPRDYKRIWDALTGKWFMYPVALGVGMDLMNY